MLLIKLIIVMGIFTCLTTTMADAADAQAEPQPLSLEVKVLNDPVELGEYLEVEVTVKNLGEKKDDIPELILDYRSVVFAFPEDDKTEELADFDKMYVRIGHDNGNFTPIEHLVIARGETSSAVFKIPTCEAGKGYLRAIYKLGPTQVISPAAEYTVTGDGKELVCRMETTQGEMILEFYPEAAFNHVMHFVDRVQTGGYDGLLFHRVISGFMIQGGDPLGTGYGGPGYMIPQEFNNTPHEPGVLSMARSNDVNSAGCQFFICHKKKEILDGQYTAFGKVIEGLDVVNKIAATRVDEGDRPIEDQKMISLKIETREAK